jgi:hypothetical protein
MHSIVEGENGPVFVVVEVRHLLIPVTEGEDRKNCTKFLGGWCRKACLLIVEEQRVA